MSKHVHEKSKAVINRLSRVEGHIRGIIKMVEEGKNCEDIIIQVSAVQSALKNISILILQDHLKHCVVEEVEEGNSEETLEQLNRALKYMLKHN